MFTLENNFIKIAVKSFGAELCSVKSKQTNIEYIWQADDHIWARHAPNLFPVVGKLYNNEFIYENKTYQLSQHGFARDNEFVCIEQTKAKLVFDFSYSEKTLVCYPFQFNFRVTYQLMDNSVEVIYTICNTDTKELYFSVGAHPAFNCPLESSECFEDYELQFNLNKNPTINALSNGLISNSTCELLVANNKLPITKKLFENDALVFLNAQINEVSLNSTKSKHGIKLTSENWPYFGIWSKPQTQNFVCLEPWYGIADFENTNQQLKTKTGIIELKSDTEFNCNYSMTFF